MRVQAQGMQLEQYLAMTGTDPEQFSQELKDTATVGRQGRPRPAGRGRRRGHRVHRRGPRPTSSRAWPTGWASRSTRCASASSAPARSRRYAPTSGSARRSSGCSSGPRCSTPTVRPSIAASSSSPRRGRRRRRRRRRGRRARRGGGADRCVTSTAARARPTAQIPCPPSSSSPTRRASRSRATSTRRLMRGAHHLPGHADRRHDRQPHLRPAAPPRVGEPRPRHQPLHQQPRRRHHGALRHLRHHVVHQARHLHHLLRAGRLGRGGAPRRRHARASAWPCPHARVLLHQPWGQAGGQATDVELAAREILRMRVQLDEILAHHTGQTAEKIHTDTERDFVMSADEAVAYGIIDEVISARTHGRHHPAPSPGPAERGKTRGQRGSTTWPSSETGESC